VTFLLDVNLLIALIDPGALVSPDEIATPAQVTDANLLALAVAHGGALATLDRRLSTKAVRRGGAGLHVVAGA
jgi:uncharacterized protein